MRPRYSVFDPVTSLPSPFLRGRSFGTFETRVTAGINRPRNRIKPLYVTWVNDGGGRILVPGTPLVFQASARIPEIVTVSWIVRIYGSARGPEHPTWFHEFEVPVREYGFTQPVADVFQIPSEEVPPGLSTVEIEIVGTSVDGEVLAEADAVIVIEYALLSDNAVLVPGPMLSAELALPTAVVPPPLALREEQPTVLVPPPVAAAERSPAVIVDPLQIG